MRGAAGWRVSGVQDHSAGCVTGRDSMHQARDRCTGWHTVPMLQASGLMQ